MTDKATVLVTGASGFIGSHCVQQLLQANYIVRGTVFRLNNELEMTPIQNLDKSGRLQLVQADLLNQDDWHRAVSGCRYVLHVASPLPKVGTADERTIRTAVEGTLNVLRAAAASNTVQRVVLTSSAAAIFDLHLRNKIGDKMLNEDDWTDISLRNVDAYTRSKVVSERAAWQFVTENTGTKFDLAVINPVITIGPARHKLQFTSAVLVKRLLQSRLPFTAAMWLPCCDVRDVARAHVAAMIAPEAANRRHLIASRPDYNTIQMAKDLAEEFNPHGYKVPTTRTPHLLLWLASWFDKEAAEAYRQMGPKLKLDTSRMTHILGIHQAIDPRTSAIEMAYSLIAKGHVKRNPGCNPKT